MRKMAQAKVLYEGLFLSMVLYFTLTSAAHFSVDTSKVIFNVDPEFISANIDSGLVTVITPRWNKFDVKSPKVLALLRGLTPCYLRFGGSSADLTVYSEDRKQRLPRQPTSFKMGNIFSEDIDTLVNLTRTTGSRLLYDMNLEVRFFNDWDPSNAERLLSYMASKGYGENIDFELGNEPASSPMEPISGKQMGHDYLSFIQLVKSYPNFRQSKVVGPDIVSVSGMQSLLPDFLSVVGKNLTALTFHHYYFNGLNAKPSEYINPQHLFTFQGNVQQVNDLVRKYSSNRDLPVWVGETADAWHSGTQNISDRYISGFLWLDKLGVGAQNGLRTIMRQTFFGGYYALINNELDPNPDYWLSYIHKKLVGRQVFNTTITDVNKNSLNYLLQQEEEGTPSLVRLFCHCTKPSSVYAAGALTVFGLNLKNVSDIVEFDSQLAQQPVDQYLLLPGEGGLLSQTVTLNGVPLHLVEGSQLPTLKPVSLPNVSKGIKFPAQTFGFWVFPKIRVQQCM